MNAAASMSLPPLPMVPMPEEIMHCENEQKMNFEPMLNNTNINHTQESTSNEVVHTTIIDDKEHEDVKSISTNPRVLAELKKIQTELNKRIPTTTTINNNNNNTNNEMNSNSTSSLEQQQQQQRQNETTTTTNNPAAMYNMITRAQAKLWASTIRMSECGYEGFTIFFRKYEKNTLGKGKNSKLRMTATPGLQALCDSNTNELSNHENACRTQYLRTIEDFITLANSAKSVPIVGTCSNNINSNCNVINDDNDNNNNTDMLQETIESSSLSSSNNRRNKRRLNIDENDENDNSRKKK